MSESIGRLATREQVISGLMDLAPAIATLISTKTKAPIKTEVGGIMVRVVLRTWTPEGGKPTTWIFVDDMAVTVIQEGLC
jgi:hypothetical protein